MSNGIGSGEISRFLWGGTVFLIFLMSSVAGLAIADPFTIGMIRHPSIHDQTLAGFKAGMAELGYVEGRDVRYIFGGVEEGTPEKIDASIMGMMAQNVALFFTAGNFVTSRVKLAVAGTDIPVLFAASTRPVEDGLVESLGSPGGNLTGVRVPNTAAKALEWLCRILPDVQRVSVPYNADDPVSISNLEGLDAEAAKLGIELVPLMVKSVEEATAAVERLPADMDAILRIPSPTLDPKNNELIRAAVRRRIPAISALPLDNDEVLTFAADPFRSGMQAARLAHMIRCGAKPSDLPVETSDAFLVINLKTAEKIGLHIPDEILLQAKKIIR